MANDNIESKRLKIIKVVLKLPMQICRSINPQKRSTEFKRLYYASVLNLRCHIGQLGDTGAHVVDAFQKISYGVPLAGH